MFSALYFRSSWLNLQLDWSFFLLLLLLLIVLRLINAAKPTGEQIHCFCSPSHSVPDVYSQFTFVFFFLIKKEVRTWRSTFTHCRCYSPVSESTVYTRVWTWIQRNVLLLLRSSCVIDRNVCDRTCLSGCLSSIFHPSFPTRPPPSWQRRLCGAAADLQLHLCLLAAEWQELLREKHPNKIWLPSDRGNFFVCFYSFFIAKPRVILPLSVHQLWALQGANFFSFLIFFAVVVVVITCWRLQCLCVSRC